MKSHENKAVPYGERCSLGCKLDLILLINCTIGIDLQLTKHIRIRNKNQQKKSITYLPSISIDEINHMLFELLNKQKSAPRHFTSHKMSQRIHQMYTPHREIKN